MIEENALGSYLRVRRAQRDPASQGLAPSARRRVTGLRREEVADLAGLSLPYYIRLEQGVDRYPSPPVLDALARVLGIDEQGRRYMTKLCERVTSGVDRDDEPRAQLVALLGQISEQPVLLLSRHRDVLAANPLATRLNPNFTRGTNLMREVFLDSAARTTYPDWPQVAAEGVAALRASIGANRNDHRGEALVSDLIVGSTEFAELWANHDAREKPSGRQRFHVPAVGVLTLNYEPFTVPYSHGQTLYVFFAMEGTNDAVMLSELAT